MKVLFRFQNLDIWKKAVEIGNKLFDIAERSVSTSAREFIQFLNIARRSTKWSAK